MRDESPPLPDILRRAVKVDGAGGKHTHSQKGGSPIRFPDERTRAGLISVQTRTRHARMCNWFNNTRAVVCTTHVYFQSLYLLLVGQYVLVPVVLRRPGGLAPPEPVGDPGVGEGDHQEGHEVLDGDQGYPAWEKPHALEILSVHQRGNGSLSVGWPGGPTYV